MTKAIIRFLVAAIAFATVASGGAQAQSTFYQGAMVPSAAPFIGYPIIAKSTVPVPLTGGTAETALATVAIPPNLISSSGAIKVTTFWTMTNSGNQKSMRVRLGAAALAGSVVFSGSATTIASSRTETTILAANATNSQNSISLSPRGTDYLVSEAAVVTTSIDLTAAQNIVITGQLATGSETLTLVGYIVQAAY